MTNVLFLKHPEDDDIYAFFPDIHWDSDKRYLTSYAHIGQHGAIHPDYVTESEEVGREVYQSLLDELIGIGYDLNILNKLR